MPLHITHRDLEDAHRYARDAVSRLQGVGRSDGVVSRSVNLGMKALATCLGAGVVGLISGKYGSADLKVGGKSIPLDAVGALLGCGVAACMEDGMASEALGNVSVGALAAFTTKYTIGMGKAWDEKGSPFAGFSGGKPAPAVTSGEAPVRQFAPPRPALTELELAKMAQAIR